MTKGKKLHSYLKVTSKDDAHPISNLTSVLQEYQNWQFKQDSKIVRDHRFFGFLNELYLLRTNDYAVVRFDPYFVDDNISKKDAAYETAEQAQDAAIKFLDDKGYSAKHFDLEGMIEKV